MTDKIRVGMIGTGWWADWMHLPSVASHSRADVVAICGRTREPAERLATKYRIPAIYADYQEMLENADLDAVIVATPDDTHHPIAMFALNKGLHLLCEKPLANTLADAEEMARTAERMGVKHMTLFTWRWSPVWAELKKQLESNSIGRCHEARFAWLGDGAWNKDYRWRRDAGRCNGVVADLGAHVIDFVRWTLDDIDSVRASLFTHCDRGRIEPTSSNDTAHLDVTTRSGTHAHIQLCVAAHLGDQRARIDAELYGERGTLTVEYVYFGAAGGATLRRCGADGAAFEQLHRETFQPDFEGRPAFLAPFVENSAGPRAFIDAIVADRPAIPDLNDGLEAQKVIAAAIESDKKGCAIKL